MQLLLGAGVAGCLSSADLDLANIAVGQNNLAMLKILGAGGINITRQPTLFDSKLRCVQRGTMHDVLDHLLSVMRSGDPSAYVDPLKLTSAMCCLRSACIRISAQFGNTGDSEQSEADILVQVARQLFRLAVEFRLACNVATQVCADRDIFMSIRIAGQALTEAEELTEYDELAAI